MIKNPIIMKPVAVHVAESINFYVSLQGNDSWDGTLPENNGSNTKGPFRTITKARDAIRALKESGVATNPINVYLREGIYYLDQTLLFTPEDSGTETAPITYTAYNNEKPVISGGKEITGTWQKENENSSIYSVDVQDASNGAWKFRSLFSNDRREIRARYPNYIPDDIYGHSNIYVYPDSNQIIAGLAKRGDFIEYGFDIAESGNYQLFLGYTTVSSDNQNILELTVDGQSVTIGTQLTATGGWRNPKYFNVASVNLTAGSHKINLANTAYPAEVRVHMDGFVFTDNLNFQSLDGLMPPCIEGEKRIVIQAEDEAALTAGYSSIGFLKFYVGDAATGGDKVTIHADKAKLKNSWALEPDATVDLTTCLNYYNELLSIDSVDQANGILKVKGPETEMPIVPGNYFYVSGIKEELDMPGEWYLNSTVGKLYYWSKEGENPNDLSFVAPKLERIIEMEGNSDGTERVSWIKFKGLAFKHCAETIGHVDLRTPTDGAVRLKNASNNTFEDNLFANVDGFGLWLHLDSCDNVIAGNTMEYMGSGGILMTSAVLGYGTSDKTYDPNPAVAGYAPLRNIIKRNLIHHGNEVRANGAGILLDTRPESAALKPGNLMLFNEIHHMKRQGIFGFRNQGGNIVENNYIHHVMLETADGGGINFAGGNNLVAPTLIKNNLVHDVVGLKRMKEGERDYFCGVAIYLDHAASRFRVENNIVYNTVQGSYLSNGGQFNSLINNIFAQDTKTNNQIAEMIHDWMRGIVIVNNVFANTSRRIDQYSISAATGSAFRNASILNTLKTNPSTFINSNKNVLWNAGYPVEINPIGSLEQWKALGEDMDSVDADPLFIDVANGNYNLKPESPAFAMGFKPININNVGVNAQLDNEPTLSQVTVANTKVSLQNAISEGDTARRYVPQITTSANYLVYAKRPSIAIPTPNVSVIIKDANGRTNASFNQWPTPGSNPTNKMVYIGTYEFKEGDSNNSVTFQRNDEFGITEFPTEILFVQANPLNEEVSYLREVIPHTYKSEIKVGETTKIIPIGIGDDGNTENLEGAQVSYTLKDPSLANISSSGVLTANKSGMAEVIVEVSLNGIKVKSIPICIKIGTFVYDTALSIKEI